MTRILYVFLAGCFQSIAPDVPDASPFDPTTGKFATTRAADGSYTTIVDSSSMTAWTHGDFETGGEVAASEPWDLRFQRFHISANVDVEVAPLDGSSADIADWYDYDPTNHVLTPKPLVWAVRTNGGSTIELEIARYYDEAGNAGWFTLHWRPR